MMLYVEDVERMLEAFVASRKEKYVSQETLLNDEIFAHEFRNWMRRDMGCPLV